MWEACSLLLPEALRKVFHPDEAPCIEFLYPYHVRAAKETGAIITVENHSVIGGLGSAVAEVLAEQCPCKMHRLGIQDRFGEVGDRAYLRKCMGIDTTDIVDAALNIKK